MATTPRPCSMAYGHWAADINRILPPPSPPPHLFNFICPFSFYYHLPVGLFLLVLYGPISQEILTLLNRWSRDARKRFLFDSRLVSLPCPLVPLFFRDQWRVLFYCTSKGCPKVKPSAMMTNNGEELDSRSTFYRSKQGGHDETISTANFVLCKMTMNELCSRWTLAHGPNDLLTFHKSTPFITSCVEFHTTISTKIVIRNWKFGRKKKQLRCLILEIIELSSAAHAEEGRNRNNPSPETLCMHETNLFPARCTDFMNGTRQ